MKLNNLASVVTSVMLQSTVILSTPVDGVNANRRASSATIPPGCELTCASFTTNCSAKEIGYSYRQLHAYNACQASPECQSVMYQWDPYPSYYFYQPKSECVSGTIGGTYGYQSKFADDGVTPCPFIPDDYLSCQT
jgi:hypothetical protein